VTLRSTDGDALSSWLSGNGYFIPPEIEPTIAAYVSEGADFIALRLQPGVGVSQMTPVRVVTPGGDFLLPLRMVAAGVGQFVDIVLYVIGEERYSMPDLRQVFVDPKALVWDFADNTSNYAELRENALGELDGFNYLVTFAFPQAFSRTFEQQGFPVNFQAGGLSFINTFADLYFAQARSNDQRTSGICPSIVSRLTSDELVTEASSAEFACQEYSDIAAALIGMHPGRVWVSRLELNLPKEALTMDCVLTPDPSSSEVSHLHDAIKAKNRPEWCDEAVFESRLAARPPSRVSVWLALIGAAVALGLRRRRAR
jgi:hypothetical protein